MQLCAIHGLMVTAPCPTHCHGPWRRLMHRLRGSQAVQDFAYAFQGLGRKEVD